MTRMTWLPISLAIFTAALVGCGGVNNPAAGGDASADQGPAGRGTGTGGHIGTPGDAGGADVGIAGTGGIRIAGTGGSIAGVGGAGPGGAGVGGAGGVRIGTGGAGVGGAPAGTGGAGAGGAIGTGGAPGTGGGAGGAAGATGGATGTDAAVPICQDQELCSGESCQTACDATGKTTFCACIPASGNTMQLSCATFSCNRDAGATDARPGFAVCAADIMDKPDCDLTTDTVCATSCTAELQTQCVCVPHGGGGNGRWTCGAPGACH